MLLWFVAVVHGDKEDLHDPFVADRQWDTEVAERIEDHRHVATIGTHQHGPEEAMESVHNHWVVLLFVVLPGLLSNLMIWPPAGITQLEKFLLLDTTEVFMQPIQEELQQLL